MQKSKEFVETKARLLRLALLGCLTVFLGLTPNAFANGLALSAGEIKDQNAVNNTALIEFDLSWKNSWKDGVNHDAAWVFVKFSTDYGVTWKHATLALSGSNPNGFSTGKGTAADVVVPSDLRGAFVQRSTSGQGDVVIQDLQFVWDYGVDGVSDTDVASTLMLKVFGIEMVYVSSGPFFAGDNGVAQASFRQGGADLDPWYITSADQIQVTPAAGDGFYYQGAGYLGEDTTGSSFTIPAAFPNGYRAFYAMKYEVSEGEWISFFNLLTDAQKSQRDLTGADGKNTDQSYQRNTVSWPGSGLAVSDRENRACNYLSWMDACAFADWAGLRPMTELEFEKLSRGKDVPSVPGEYAWGTTSIVTAATVSGSETGSEVVSNSGANAHYGNGTVGGGDGSQGPLRVGIFATASSQRTAAGAGYYGATELVGNLAEKVVSVGNAQGRSFLGTHGDGALSFVGFANNSDWPGFDGAQVSAALGSGLRGGGWSDSALRLRLSDRQEASQGLTNRHSRFGFRAVRLEI